MDVILGLVVLCVAWTWLTDPGKSQTPEDVARRGRIREQGCWRGLLNRADVLIVDTKTSDYSEDATVDYVAVIDTTGKTRYVAGLDKDFPTIHSELLPVLRGADRVIAWDVAFNKRVLSREAEFHNLKPALPRVRWYDVKTDYDTGGPSLRYAA